MNLKEFNKENSASVRGLRTAPASVGISLKSGLFNFNTAACEIMKLESGSQVKFFQDEDHPDEWYLEVVKEGGFVCRKKENVTAGMLFNSSRVAKKHC